MKLSFFLYLVLVLSGVMADAGDFTVSIVGQEQSNQWQYKDAGLPLVYCPPTTPGPANARMVDKSSGMNFYVVIQSTQTNADTIMMAASGWYDCLQFKITDRSGQVYSVARAEIDWSANPEMSWTFPGGGIRVMAVDFTSRAMFEPMGGWLGLPPSPSEPEIASMTATFRYGDSEGQKTVTSKPIRIYLREPPK
jgi:hypothetical protein